MNKVMFLCLLVYLATMTLISACQQVFRARLAQPLPAGHWQTTHDPADIALTNGQAVTSVNFGAVISADLT